MSIWSLLATYFSNPGIVKDYFKSREINQEGTVEINLESINAAPPAAVEDSADAENPPAENRYPVRRFAVYAKRQYEEI